MKQHWNNSTFNAGGVATVGRGAIGRPSEAVNAGKRGCDLGGTCGGMRRATVMVMVVAMLSMLFVVGTAFLATVSFEGAAIEGAKRQKSRNAVVDQLSREVRQALRDSMLGSDGLPFNQELVDTDGNGVPDAISPIGNDTYGEIPGVHPLIASVEPYDPDQFGTGMGMPAVFFAASDLEMTLDPTLGPPFINSVRIDVAIEDTNNGGMFDEIVEGDSLGGNQYRRDADSDGVWDSYEFLLSRTRYPTTVRGGLAEKLRDPDFVADPLLGQSEDDLFYGLRVIPHGAMVNVNYSHATLINQVLGSTLTSLVPRPVFAPESEEATLRNRFCLPPRELPLSAMQSGPVPMEGGGVVAGTGLLAGSLYGVFFDSLENANMFVNDGIGTPRWWLLNSDPLGDGLGEIAYEMVPGATPGWLNWMMNPADLARYDIRHLVTTASYDDNLLRAIQPQGFTPMPGVVDWLDGVDETPVGPSVWGDYAIDDYPLPANDPQRERTNGRLKVSLPYLIDGVLKLVGSPFFEDDGSGTYDNDPLAVLSDSVFQSNFEDEYNRFVWIIQDAFWLMLQNVTGTIDRETTAASLTANLIDFADSDDVPTRVEIRDNTGVGTGQFVYGLERQPYITEVYYDADNGELGVELFNPYQDVSGVTPEDDDIEGDISLTLGNYKIAMKNGDSIGPTEDLSGTISSRSFRVFGTGGNVPSSDDMINLTFDLMSDDAVVLIRESGGDEVVVDEFSVSGLNPSATGVQSVRRNTINDPNEPWHCVIPTISPVEASSNLGMYNGIDPGFIQIEPQFANTGNFRQAFPTTGSLLLLMRYANTQTSAFNQQLTGSTTVIDEGRMPVFDQMSLATTGTGPTDLALPWGQLVFDYFTALPLDNDPAQGGNPDQPVVDQGGLRIHGRININSAPELVLSGLPTVPINSIPLAVRTKVERGAFLGGSSLNPNVAQNIGQQIASSIVGYREARQVNVRDAIGSSIENTANFQATRLRQMGFGFLTVGELANVRGGGASSAAYSIDGDVINGAASVDDLDYTVAVGLLVALGDWVTTRSDVFTVYGTVRGAGRKEAVDQRAIRFQETVDRLPTVLNPQSLPKFVGRRIVGSYAQVGE